MSADEIRKLAESCKDKANYYKNMTPCSDAEKEKWYMDASKMEADKAIALLAYAAMVERCGKAVESMHTQLMHLANEGKTTVDIGRLSKYFAHLENILRGDVEKEGK